MYQIIPLTKVRKGDISNIYRYISGKSQVIVIKSSYMYMNFLQLEYSDILSDPACSLLKLLSKLWTTELGSWTVGS